MKKAFTLIELMLVVIIIGVLASLVVPRLTGRTERAKAAAAKADIEANIPTALDLYEADTGSYPVELSDLLKKPQAADDWAGPYLKRAPKDPWGREYYYKFPATHGGDYDLASSGKDGSLGNDDDVVNW